MTRMLEYWRAFYGTVVRVENQFSKGHQLRGAVPAVRTVDDDRASLHVQVVYHLAGTREDHREVIIPVQRANLRWGNQCKSKGN